MTHLFGNYTVIAFMLVGFCAQMIDGAIGMAYGVISSSLLLFLGYSPVQAGASLKMAEMVTTGVSGVSHHLFGNIDRKLLVPLLVPGVIGGILGAYILTNIPGDIIKPFISAYLVVMGVVIIVKAFRASQERNATPRAVAPLGLVGGFFDAIGGGGWGPIVTTNMVAMGHSPRKTIGTVNAAEFFVTVAQAVTFVVTLLIKRQSGDIMWQISLGLLLGGVLAAPLAAYLCKRLTRRTIMVLVGVLICTVSTFTIYKAALKWAHPVTAVHVQQSDNTTAATRVVNK